MQIYSGGLGILSGDHLKAASDGDFALTGVGLLYQRGYLQQHLNPDGWQQERTPLNDFYTLPIRPCTDERGAEILVSVQLPTGELFIKVWHISVGRVTLYLLDTNIPQNRPARIARSPINCMAAISTSASGRKSYSASAACARSRSWASGRPSIT